MEEFEKYLLDLGWDSFKLRKHVYGKTWWGSEDTMPTFVESHTEALWSGWCIRDEVKSVESDWFKTNAPLPSGWYWRRGLASPNPEMYYSDGRDNVKIGVYTLEYVAYAAGDWSGEWYGPIEPPK